MSKQKSYYKSLLLTTLGLSLLLVGIINIIIFSLTTTSDILIVIFVFVSLLGFIIFVLDDNINLLNRHSNVYPTLFYKYFIYGVPNNKYKEFEVNTKELLMSNNITVLEETNNIFKTSINGKNLCFDLTGWNNKNYCLYEYFISVIQTELSKHDYKKTQKPINIKNVDNLILTIIYRNNKKKNIELIKNNKTLLTFKLKTRLSIKCDILGGKKVFIKDLYEFNI